MFDRVFVINLNRRPDRWAAFQQRMPARWPFPQVERWTAIDGEHAVIPEWFRTGRGAWGCLRTHVAIWWEMIECEHDSILVLEDDAVFCNGAVDIIERTMEMVPDDWDQVYFGGQHLDTNDRPPEVVIQDKLVRCRYTNRTHAYAIRNKFACEALEVIDAPNDRDARTQHVDYLLGDLHDSHNIYAPWRFCIGQARGASDVRENRRMLPRHTVEHWWNQFPIVEPARVG